jgi:hypothetical protein
MSEGQQLELLPAVLCGDAGNPNPSRGQLWHFLDVVLGVILKPTSQKYVQDSPTPFLHPN